MILSKCAVCDSQKLRSIKIQDTSGLLSNLGLKIPLSKIPLLGDTLTYKMNEIVSKFLIGDKLMHEMDLRQHGFIYSAFEESAKLCALRAKNVLTFQRTLPAYVLTCQRTLRAYVLKCQHIFHACMLTSQRALRAYVLMRQHVLHAYMLTCQSALHAHVSTCFTCSREKPGKVYNVCWYRSYTLTFLLCFFILPVLIQRY